MSLKYGLSAHEIVNNTEQKLNHSVATLQMLIPKWLMCVCMHMGCLFISIAHRAASVLPRQLHLQTLDWCIALLQYHLAFSWLIDERTKVGQC